MGKIINCARQRPDWPPELNAVYQGRSKPLYRDVAITRRRVIAVDLHAGCVTWEPVGKCYSPHRKMKISSFWAWADRKL